jgi:hypothetical protein
MVKVLLAASAIHLLSFTGTAIADAPEAASVEEELVPVALDHRDGVSGETLAIAAYSFIFALIALYVVSLWKRQRAVNSKVNLLKERIERAARARTP